jgi:Ni/Co efflux regulator RcnB
MMKKLILAAAGVTILIAAPASAQTFGHRNDRGRVEQVQRQQFQNRDFARQRVQVSQVQNRRWNQGERFDSRYASNYRVIGNPSAYRLRQAPRGYRWVQSGNDAVLVALASGLIGAIIGNALN